MKDGKFVRGKYSYMIIQITENRMQKNISRYRLSLYKILNLRSYRTGKDALNSGIFCRSIISQSSAKKDTNSSPVVQRNLEIVEMTVNQPFSMYVGIEWKHGHILFYPHLQAATQHLCARDGQLPTQRTARKWPRLARKRASLGRCRRVHSGYCCQWVSLG